jgi:N-acetylmuramoyl-L-alanine amidase
MARMPGTTWRPVPNYSGGACGPVVGMVAHHTVGSAESAYAHFANPGSGASAHFIVTYAGDIWQCVDTADAAYHACGANYAGQVGVEHESPGDGPDVWQALTDAQVSASARILAWLHDAHGVELRVADINNRHGLGYHSMVPGPCTANDWGSTGCPGDAIVGQRAEIVRQAQGGVAPAPEPVPEGEKVYVKFGWGGGQYLSDLVHFRWISDEWDLRAIERFAPDVQDAGPINGLQGFGVPADPVTAELAGLPWPTR